MDEVTFNVTPATPQKRNHDDFAELLQEPVTSLMSRSPTTDRKSTPRHGSPAPSTTSSLTELTTTNDASDSVLKSGGTSVKTPPAKKRKLGLVEAQAEKAKKQLAKEEKAKQKAEEKIRKEEEKAQKDDEKRRAAEEKENAKRAKELEKAEKQKVKDEEKQKKDAEKALRDAQKAQKEAEKREKEANKEAEKAKKEAEKLKKERVSPRIVAHHD